MTPTWSELEKRGEASGSIYSFNSLALLRPVCLCEDLRMAIARRKAATIFGCRNLLQSSVPIGRRRCFASIAPSTSEGPLAGLRVLDMTRVLAGVCDSFSNLWSKKLTVCQKALLYPNTWRPRVCQMIPACSCMALSCPCTLSTASSAQRIVLMILLGAEERKSLRSNILHAAMTLEHGALPSQHIPWTLPSRGQGKARITYQ